MNGSALVHAEEIFCIKCYPLSLVFLEAPSAQENRRALRLEDIPSFKNLWLFGPSIFVEFTMTNTGVRGMRSFERTLKRFYKPCVWPDGQRTVIVERF
jgi:hypothetical protein